MCNFSRMIKNVLPSLRQRAGPQRICSRQKSIRSGTARDSFSQTPHMRGKVVRFGVRAGALGITPAYAGKSCSYNSRTTASGDHPRMCGEKRLGIPCGVYGYGSPPRIRGKVCFCLADVLALGITPAHAGKRQHQGLCPQAGRDHPRMCGEKAQRARGLNLILGSPPHVRGKAFVILLSIG